MSVAQQAKRARKKMRIDPRYHGAKAGDAGTRARREAAKIERARKMAQKK